jgi:tetratricopeptide (TPR) repeat protein
MIKKVFFSLLVCCIFLSASAQKGLIQKAYNYYKEPYQQYDEAKKAIDEAMLVDENKSNEKAWYYRGLIYHALYSSSKYGHLCDNCLITAYESFTKVNEIKPDNEWAEIIKGLNMSLLMRDFFNKGVEDFNHAKYADALTSFEYVQKINPSDTSAVLNAAFAADKAQNLEKAKLYYNRLINMNYKDDKIYMSLASIYKQENDSARALGTIRDGRKVFPDSLSLMLTEINLLLSAGRSQEATEVMETALTKDPKNQSLYLALGSTYDQLANPRDASGNDLPKPVNHSELMSKAEQTYLRGLALDVNNFELNYNLGAIYFNQGAEMANAANNIKDNAAFEAAKTKANAKFLQSEPYLEKAFELNGTDKATLTSLKMLYARTGETDKYNRITAILDNMK